MVYKYYVQKENWGWGLRVSDSEINRFIKEYYKGNSENSIQLSIKIKHPMLENVP